MRLKCSKCGTPVDPGAGLDPGDSCPHCGSPLIAVRPGTPEGDRGPDSSSLRRGILSEGSFGPYEVIEEVARGGMGVVYKAREKDLKRLVAIKVLISGGEASDEEIRRFRREAEAASRLQHSNIVPIHAIGEISGRPYFVMDFIEGKTVSDMIEDGELTPRMSLEIVEQVAEALHYAHQRGVIHRDMKPANVIIDKLGRPQIMDFGLAKQVDEDVGLTRSGTTMGTPAYMPPEQAEGDLAGIDAQSDVYALGAVLYEMLTGQPPFDGPTTMNILMKVLEEEPDRPRHLNPRVHRDIETICLKAMAKEKSRRYQSARDLAEDIRRFIAGEVIAASPAGLLYRFWKATMRNKEVTAAVSAAFAALMVTLVWLGWRAHNESIRIERERATHFSEEFGAGKNLFEAAKRALGKGKTDSAGERFSLAMAAFERALWLKPKHPGAVKYLTESKQGIRQIKIKEYLALGKKFCDQEIYEAGEAMYSIVIKDYDEDNEAAEKGIRRARGICTVAVRTKPAGASVYLKPVNLEGAAAPKDFGELLKGRSDVTPVIADDVEMGDYRVTITKHGYATDEFPISLGRSELLDLPEIELIPEEAGPANMVRIPGGSAKLDGREVSMREFYIDRYEYPNRWGEKPKTDVSWIEAQKLCTEQGKRLCALAEWSRACQGNDYWAFPYGSSHQATTCNTGKTTPTASSSASGTHVKCASTWGAYDMSGNVAEWVSTPGQSPGLAAGGNWSQTLPSSLTCTSTLFFPPSQGWSKVGFRCCKGEGAGPVAPPPKADEED